MIELILAIVAGLIAALPAILKGIERRVSDGNSIREKLVQRDLTQLHADLERLRARKTRPLVSQR